MPAPESDYWSGEISDAEIDAMADQGDQLSVSTQKRQKSAAQKAASERRKRMAKAVKRGDGEAFSKELQDPQRIWEALTDVEGQVLQLADELLDEATSQGMRSVVRKSERTISRLQDCFDDLENILAQLNAKRK